MIERIARFLLFISIIIILSIIILPIDLGFVQSDSMQPEIDQGDLFIIISGDKEQYNEGEIIVFHSESMDSIVTHRIVDVTEEGYITQGDNNQQTDQERGDSLIQNNDIIGQVYKVGDTAFTVPYFGYIAQYIGDNTISVISVLIVLLIIDIILNPNKDSKYNRKTDRDYLSPLKVLLLISFIFILSWSILSFLTVSTASPVNAIIVEDEGATSPQITIGDTQQRTQIIEASSSFGIIPVEKQFTMNEGEIDKVERIGLNTYEIYYTIGPYTETGFSDIEISVYTYPDILPSNIIEYMHNINPIMTSLVTYSLLIVPIIIIGFIAFNGPIRLKPIEKKIERILN